MFDQQGGGTAQMFDRESYKLSCIFGYFFFFFFDRVPLPGACEVTLAETHMSRQQGSFCLWGFLSYFRLGVAVHSLSSGQCNTPDVCIKQNQSLWFADNKHPSNGNEHDVI